MLLQEVAQIQLCSPRFILSGIFLLCNRGHYIFSSLINHSPQQRKMIKWDLSHSSLSNQFPLSNHSHWGLFPACSFYSAERYPFCCSLGYFSPSSEFLGFGPPDSNIQFSSSSILHSVKWLLFHFLYLSFHNLSSIENTAFYPFVPHWNNFLPKSSKFYPKEPSFSPKSYSLESL